MRPLLSTLLLLAPLAASAQLPQNAGPNTLDSTAAPAQTAGAASTTVSVPLNDGDTMNVTGPLALRHRGSRQFFVIESPTPYRISSPLGSDGPSAKPHIIHDIAFTLPGQQQDLTEFVGRTVTASGKVHLQPTPTTWNGAVLQSKTVVLPGGKEIHARH